MDFRDIACRTYDAHKLLNPSLYHAVNRPSNPTVTALCVPGAMTSSHKVCNVNIYIAVLRAKLSTVTESKMQHTLHCISEALMARLFPRIPSFAHYMGQNAYYCSLCG